MTLSFYESLFNDIVPDLDRNNIKLTLLRDIDTVNNVIKLGVGDVDLYTNERNWKEASVLFRKHGFFNLFENQIFKSINHENVLDLYHGFYKRAPFFTDSELTKGELLDSGFLELPQHLLLAILLLHPLDLTGIRGNRNYSKARKSTISKLYNIDEVKKQFLEWCQLSIGYTFAKQIERFVANDLEYTRLDLLKMKLTLFICKPEMFKFFCKRVLAKFLPAPHMKGRVISVMGVDGSGKTTLLTELSLFLKTYMGNAEKVHYLYMGRQGGHRLPLEWFASFLTRIRKNSKQIEMPSQYKSKLSREAKAAKTFNRPIWKVIFPIEYGIRLIEILYLVLFRRKIVLTDRYVDDFSQDDSVSFVLRKLINLFPKPSHVLLIVGDTSIFYERKGEYSPHELDVMQNKLLTRLHSAYGNRLTILDGNQSATDVLTQALAALHND